jgi:hypothetical protein
MWRRRTAELTLLSGEALAIFLVAAVLADGAGGAGPSYLVLLAAMVGGFALVRFLFKFDTGRTGLVAAAAVLSVAGIWLLASLEYDRSTGPFAVGWIARLLADPETYLGTHWAVTWGVVLIGFAWLRAGATAQRELTYARAVLSFSVGLGLLVVFLLFTQGSGAEQAVNTAALPYFMLGLLTLALVHLSRAEYQQGAFVRGPWLPTLVATVGGLALVAAFVGLFPLGLLNTLLAPVGVLALHVIDLIILVIAYPMAIIITWLFALITGGRKPDLPPPNQVATDGVQKLQDQAQQGGPPALLLFLFKLVFVTALVAVIGYILWRAYRRLSRPAGEAEGDETREALAGEDGFGSDIGALVGALLGRFHRGPPEHEPALPGDVLAVRRAYLHALRRAEDAGTTRPSAETPNEFAPALARALHAPAAETLSQRFATARYGGVAPSREELSRIEREVNRG